MKAYNKKGVLTFYGVVRDIIDLDYTSFRHTVFYYNWVDVDEKNAYKVKPTSKLVMVNLSKLMSRGVQKNRKIDPNQIEITGFLGFSARFS